MGGRTLSIKIKNPQGEDDALDMGAHWVSTRQPHVMELIEKFGIGYYPQNTTGTKIMQVYYLQKCLPSLCACMSPVSPAIQTVESVILPLNSKKDMQVKQNLTLSLYSPFINLVNSKPEDSITI